MNILMIVGEKRPIPWSKGGAIQTYVDEVSKYLKNEHQLTILSTAYPSIGEEETFDSIRYVRSNLTVNEIQQFIQIESFDLIHIFNQARLIVPIREVAPDSKLVLSIHSNFFKREHFTRFEANEILQQLDHIITNNENITKTISTLFKIDRTKLKTIYSGVKIEQFSHQNTQQNQHIRKNIRSEYDISDKKVVLLTGQFSPNKGVDIFLEAIKQLADKYPNMALIMVSSQAYNDYHDGEYISYLRELAEKIQIPVFHSGINNNSELQKWFPAADVFVCPSPCHELLTGAHYEAMASGLPIITTNESGCSEVIQANKAGIIVMQPQLSSDFVEHLLTLFHNDDFCAKLGENGRKLAEKQFSWDRVAREILDTWRILYKETQSMQNDLKTVKLFSLK